MEAVDFMKKAANLILALCICLFFTACGTEKAISSEKGDVKVTIAETDDAGAGSALKKDALKEDEGTEIHETTDNYVKPLEKSDFSVSDGRDIIYLDTPYSELDIDIPEEETGNSYIGETYSGEFVYKNYIHVFGPFDLYVSNANYNLKGRNFDEYYITQITLKNSDFRTPRGITVGTDAEDIYRAYGRGTQVEEDGRTVLIYTLDDMEISFTIDEEQKVRDVILRIIVDGQ